MAGLVYELTSILSKEKALYEEILNLTKDKREAIIERNSLLLETITGKEEKFITDLSNLDKKRERILSDMATVLGKDGEKITIDDVIKVLEGRPDEKNRLALARDGLSKVAEEVRYWNIKNQDLLNVALEMVEFDLTLFRSLKQAPETANYNNKAYNTGDLLGGSGFDTKQ